MRKKISNRSKYIIKPRISKKLIMSTIASVMAVVVAGSLLYNAAKVSVPAEAQHAMSGVSEAIKDHGSGQSFVILDIVPGRGTTDNGLALGTMSYLTSEPFQIMSALSEMFNHDGNTYFDCTARENAAYELINDVYSGANGRYEESLTGGNGWKQIYEGRAYDGEDIDDQDIYRQYTIKGHAVEATDGNGAYVAKGDLTTTADAVVVYAEPTFLSDTAFILTTGTRGYRLTASTDLSGYSDDTPIYLLDNGDYRYAGHISDHPELFASPNVASPDIPVVEDDTEGSDEGDDSTDTDGEEPGKSGESEEPVNTDPNNPVTPSGPEITPEPTVETPSTNGTEASISETKSGSESVLSVITDSSSDSSSNGNYNGLVGSGWVKFVDPDEGTEPEEPKENEPKEEELKEESPPTSEQPSVTETPTVQASTPTQTTTHTYYVLSYEYVSNLENPEQLYWPNKCTENVSTDESAEDELDEEGIQPSRPRRTAKARSTTPKELVYVGTGGDWNITSGEELLTVCGAPLYFRVTGDNLLAKEVFCSSINIKVNVKSAADVTSNDVMNADLIFLEDAIINNEDDYISANGSDMNPTVVFDIVDRAANDLLPVIVDYNAASSSKYSGTNYQKLANILLKTDLLSFYQDMENATNMLMNAYSGAKDDEDNNYVNNNIYVTSDGALAVRGTFTDPFDNISGFSEVQSAIDTENRMHNGTWIEGGVCRATIIQYIINYADGFIGDFRDFAILELQPSSDVSDLNTMNDSRNNTVLYWKKSGSNGSGQQVLRSRKSITITVDSKSVAEFVGEQDDINDTYQMVFIGLDGKSLNYSGKDTVYNDSALNGKVYSGVGDIAYTVDGTEVRYDGVDITPQKKAALLNFLRAGYPVVVENDFFVNKTAKGVGASAINTKYIDTSSQMYDFLKTALSEDMCKWCLYTVSDVHTNSSDFAAQVNVRRPRIKYNTDAVIPNQTEVVHDKVMQTIASDANGKYLGYIPYKVTDDIGETYKSNITTRFYMDMNQDGRFDALEEVTGAGLSISNGLLAVEFTAPERGIIPWKLEISDAGNGYRRDSLLGYFTIYHSAQMPIRVVQVLGGTEEEFLDARRNFEMAYDMMSYDVQTKALLGFYLKNAEAMTNTKLDIDTMTVAQLAAEIRDNEEYLSGVDVLVLGFGPACSLSVPVTDRNVEWYVNKYISEGRGVLLSDAASSEDLGRMQLDVSLLGQKDVKTYSKLGSSKPSSVRFYRYSTLSSSMFRVGSMLSAARVNDGAISHYPYEVGSNITIYNSVKGADYTLNLVGNDASGQAADVTAWYCLGDSSIFSERSSYGVSVKDAANNYYIYSKGNVVYIGENDYPYAYDSIANTTPAENTQGIAECKLFVNALMEAYSVGIKNPRVTIVAGLAGDSSEIDSICIPYDEQIREDEPDGILDETTDVYFKITEPNLAFRKDVTLAFYYEDAAGVPIDVGGKTVNATQFASEIWTVEQNQLVPVTVTTGLDLVPGKIYKIKAPVISLKTNDNTVYADIYIVVQSHFIKLGQDRYPVGSDSVTLNRAQLFLLE